MQSAWSQMSHTHHKCYISITSVTFRSQTLHTCTSHMHHETPTPTYHQQMKYQQCHMWITNIKHAWWISHMHHACTKHVTCGSWTSNVHREHHECHTLNTHLSWMSHLTYIYPKFCIIGTMHITHAPITSHLYVECHTCIHKRHIYNARFSRMSHMQ